LPAPAERYGDHAAEDLPVRLGFVASLVLAVPEAVIRFAGERVLLTTHVADVKPEPGVAAEGATTDKLFAPLGSPGREPPRTGWIGYAASDPLLAWAGEADLPELGLEDVVEGWIE
jgi:hypothetical protein